MSNMGYSGGHEEWLNGEIEFGFQALPEGGAVGEVLLVGSSGEVQLKRLSREERGRFRESDEAEWSSIVGSGSVRVLSLEESERCRQQFAGRIVSSRMVRRWKPQKGTFAPPKAKPLEGTFAPGNLLSDAAEGDYHDLPLASSVSGHGSLRRTLQKRVLSIREAPATDGEGNSRLCPWATLAVLGRTPGASRMPR